MTDDGFSDYAAARWPSLVRAGVVLGCSPEEADDLAQSALLRCFVSWRKVQRAENPDSYLYKILLNCHRDSRRRRWWGERPSDWFGPEGSGHLAGLDTPDVSDSVATADALARALSSLTAAHREVVVLRHLAQLTERQTADLLGIAPGTVKSRLSRAMSQLADSPHLDDHTGGSRHDHHS